MTNVATLVAPSSSKHHFRSIWISDVHLGARDAQAECLLSFLKHTRSDYLYIVGDLIDVWQLKRSWYWPQAFNNVLQKLLKKAKKGTQVFFIPGNHDEVFRDFVGYQFGGVQIRSRTIHQTADGRKLLVLHGDEFDMAVHGHRWLAKLGSAAYDYLILANRFVNAARRAAGMPYWSFSGCVKRRVKNAVKFITRFEEVLVDAARRCQVDGVICGHIHQPVIKALDNVLYGNSGDWLESCSALVEHQDGSMELLYWPRERISVDETSADAEGGFEEDEQKEEAPELADAVPFAALFAQWAEGRA